MKQPLLVLVMLGLTSPVVGLECAVPSENTLERHDCYLNRYHHERHVPSPSTGGVPVGATARCRDGAYSFSEHHSGTCSNHHGVAEWIR
jgi:hypothetical protein